MFSLRVQQYSSINTFQQKVYGDEIECLGSNSRLSKRRSLWTLDPFIDQNGLLSTGGCLKQADLGHDEKRPVILPECHHGSTLQAHHFHEKTQHKGWHFTEGAIRSAGYWISCVKRCVTSLVFKCVTLHKLKGPCKVQKMADLPPDRLSIGIPFTHMGLEVFGP